MNGAPLKRNSFQPPGNTEGNPKPARKGTTAAMLYLMIYVVLGSAIIRVIWEGMKFGWRLLDLLL